jgi:hypothetical protein
MTLAITGFERVCIIISEFHALNYKFNWANKKEKEDSLFFWIGLFKADLLGDSHID